MVGDPTDLMRLLSLCLPLVLALLPLQDDEIVKEFKRYFKKYKDSATRVEAILALEGTESAEVVKVLVPVLKDADADLPLQYENFRD